MAKEKFSPCPRCKSGRVMTSELQRGFNAKTEDNKVCCADCKVAEIYGRFGL